MDASLVSRIAERGVIVAGGLHPRIRTEYFRVGHMGYAIGRTDLLMRTIEAIAYGLTASGVEADGATAVRTFLEGLQSEAVTGA